MTASSSTFLGPGDQAAAAGLQSAAPDEASQVWFEQALGLSLPGKGPATPGAPLSLVRLGRARLGWRSDRQQAVAALGRLGDALAAAFDDDPEEADVLRAALARLDRLAARMDDALGDELDAILNEEDPARRLARRQQVRAKLATWEALIAEDEILQALDGNEVLPETAVVGPMTRRLAEIAAALG